MTELLSSFVIAVAAGLELYSIKEIIAGKLEIQDLKNRVADLEEHH